MQNESIVTNNQDSESQEKSFLTLEMIRNLEIPNFESPVHLESEVESSYKVKSDPAKVKYLLAAGVNVPKEWYSEDEGGELTSNRDFHAEIITMTVFRRRLEDVFFLLKNEINDKDLTEEILAISRDIFKKRVDIDGDFRAVDVTGHFKNREIRKRSLGLLVNPTGLVSLEELIMIRDLVLNSYRS